MRLFFPLFLVCTLSTIGWQYSIKSERVLGSSEEKVAILYGLMGQSMIIQDVSSGRDKGMLIVKDDVLEFTVDSSLARHVVRGDEVRVDYENQKYSLCLSDSFCSEIQHNDSIIKL